MIAPPPKGKKTRGESLAPPIPMVTDHAPILRVVNHIDNFKMITMKTTILNSLRNYYGHLKDKVVEEENANAPFALHYQSVRNEGRITRDHSSGRDVVSNTIS